MPEKEFPVEIADQAAEVGPEKLPFYEATDPAIRKIQQRNRQVKLNLAKKLLALGLEPVCVETILNICLPISDDSARSVLRKKEER